MLSRVVRLFLALTSVAPLLVSIAYVQATKQHASAVAIGAAAGCALLGIVSIGIMRLAARELETLNVEVQKAKPADKEVIGFYVAYALPLLFRDVGNLDFGVITVAVLMFVFVIWSTGSVQVNPVLGLFGYHFYEVELKGGISYLLVTRRRVNDLTSISHVNQLSEHALLDASKETTK